MNENSEIWFGFLEAGEKSAPVLIDTELDTGNPKTVYMYNLNSKKIIEYKREIAEPKLRTLNEKEKDLVKELVMGYNAARQEFTPRNLRTAPVPTANLTTVNKSTFLSGGADKENILDYFDMDNADMDLEDDMEEIFDPGEDE